MSDLIIDAPKLQTLRQRFAFSFLTFAFWVLWFYLWMPLVTLVAWALGFQIVYEHMVLLQGWQGLVRLLGIYALVVIGLGSIFIGWALYNNIRFRNKKRRGNPGKVAIDDMVHFYQVGDAMIRKSQRSKRVVVHFNPEGGVVKLDCDLPMN